MKHYQKGSLGPELNDLRFEVIQQANDILERILDLETRVDYLEKKLCFIIFPHEQNKEDDDYTGGE